MGLGQADGDATRSPEPEQAGGDADSPPTKWRTTETIGFLVAVVLLAACVAGVRLREPTLVTSVQVAVGSEDADFFRDLGTQAELANQHYTVAPIPMGSRDMAQNVVNESRRGYDAIFPSSDDFAQEAEAKLPDATDTPVFSTPLAVFTWRDLIPQLKAAGIVGPGGTFNVSPYLAKAGASATWIIDGKVKPLLMDMTDPAKSDSGALFIGVASIVLNGGNQIQSPSAAAAIARPILRPLVARLGDKNSTTAQIFSNYLDGQESAEPLALGYASEFIEAKQSGQLPRGAVMLQMNPSVVCVHTIVPLDAAGVKFAATLYTDKTLLSIAAQKYGFVDSAGGQIPPGNYVKAPSYQVLEAMIGVVG